MQQKRLLLALVLSSLILFLWTIFYPVPQTPPQNQNSVATSSPAASPAGTAGTQSPSSSGSTAQAAPLPTPNVNAAPQRSITIRTPLYDAKFDTLGAEPVSWIIKKNKNSGADIYSVGADKREKKPLELISPEGLQRQPRLVRLQLQTGDGGLDFVLSSSTYKVEGVDVTKGDANL